MSDPLATAQKSPSIFAGATRRHTEVLLTSVFLELSVRHLEAAMVVSRLLAPAATPALGIIRLNGARVSR